MLVPDIELSDLKGHEWHLRDNGAKITLVEFWDTSCGPCREEIPLLKKLYESIPRDRLKVLGISSDESPSQLQNFLEEFSVPWAESMELADGPLHRTFRVEANPTYFLLAKNGRILDRWVGGGQAVKRIEAALQISSR